jgi:hypothetical protein
LYLPSQTAVPPATLYVTDTLPMVNSCCNRFCNVAALALYRMGNVVLPRKVRKKRPELAVQERRWTSLTPVDVVGSSPVGHADVAQPKPVKSVAAYAYGPR